MPEVKVFTFLTDPTDDAFEKGVNHLQTFARSNPDIQITTLVQSSTPVPGGTRIANTLTIFYKRK